MTPSTTGTAAATSGRPLGRRCRWLLAGLAGLLALSVVALVLWHVVAGPAARQALPIAWVEGSALVVRSGEGLDRYLCPSRDGQPHSAKVGWVAGDIAYWSPLDSAIRLVGGDGTENWFSVAADERWVHRARTPMVQQDGDVLTAWFTSTKLEFPEGGRGDWEWSLWRVALSERAAGRPTELIRFAWPMPPKGERGVSAFGAFLVEPPVALDVTAGWAVYRRPNGLLVTTASGEDRLLRIDPAATVRAALWEPELRRLWTVEAMGGLPPKGYDRLVCYRNDGRRLAVVKRPRNAQLVEPLGTLSPEQLEAVRRLGRSASVTLSNISAEMVNTTVFYGARPYLLGPVGAHESERFRDVLASTGPPVRLVAEGSRSGHKVSWLIDPQRLQGQNLSFRYSGRAASGAPTEAGHR